jgi:hypothetical protein
MNVIKTAMAVRLLGTTYHRLFGLVRYGKIPAPQKDSSGDYVWSRRDLAAARKALLLPKALISASNLRSQQDRRE